MSRLNVYADDKISRLNVYADDKISRLNVYADDKMSRLNVYADDKMSRLNVYADDTMSRLNVYADDKMSRLNVYADDKMSRLNVYADDKMSRLNVYADDKMSRLNVYADDKMSRAQVVECVFNPFPNKPWFLRVCRTCLLKTLREKEKLLITINFSSSHSAFYLLENFLPFSSNLKCRLQTLSNWKSLIFVVLESVKKIKSIVGKEENCCLQAFFLGVVRAQQ